MLDSEDSCATLKDRAKRKLDRDMGPLLINALNDPQTVELMVCIPSAQVGQKSLIA